MTEKLVLAQLIAGHQRISRVEDTSRENAYTGRIREVRDMPVYNLGDDDGH